MAIKGKSFAKVNDGTISDEGFLRVSLVNQGVFIRKRRKCPLKEVDVSEINYKNLVLLNKFLTERGKIIPSRVTGMSTKKQATLSNAIKVARNLALISPVSKDMN